MVYPSIQYTAGPQRQLKMKKLPKYEVKEEPRLNDVVFKGGTKYTSRKGNKELEAEINLNKDEYTTADNNSRKKILEKVYNKLNDLRKGSRYFVCSEGTFKGRFIECIGGRMFLLLEKKHVYSCLRKTFTRQKGRKEKKILLTGVDQYNDASPEQKRLIWLCQGGLSKVGKYIGGIDQYNISGSVKEYYKFNNFRKHTLVSQV